MVGFFWVLSGVVGAGDPDPDADAVSASFDADADEAEAEADGDDLGIESHARETVAVLLFRPRPSWL